MVAQLIRLSRGWPVALQRACAQGGWDPRSAVLVRTPAGLSADALAALLRAMQSRIAMKEPLSRAVKMGLADSAPMVDVVDQLVVANVVKSHPRQDRGRALKIRVHGSGPLSDVVVSALRCWVRECGTPASEAPPARRISWC